jgi:hypothetical protein
MDEERAGDQLRHCAHNNFAEWSSDLNQIAIRVAIRASPTQTEARTQTFSTESYLLYQFCGWLPEHDSATRIRLSGVISCARLQDGTAVSVNSFTVTKPF